MCQRNTLEIMRVNVKFGGKRREKAFMEELNTFKYVKYVKSNCKTTNFTPVSSKTSQLNSTTKALEATQTFDDDQTPSISWINITKTNMKQNTLSLKKIMHYG